MRVLGPNKEPYYLEIDSDKKEFDSLHDNLNLNKKTLKPKTAFKEKLQELLEDIDDKL